MLDEWLASYAVAISIYTGIGLINGWRVLEVSLISARRALVKSAVAV